MRHLNISMTTAYSNRSRVSVATTGTGTVNLGSALVNFKDLSSITSGSTIGYALDDLSTGGWEVGTGVYTSGSPSTVTRANIETSTNSGSAISLSGNATLMVTLTANEINNQVVNSTAVGPGGGATLTNAPVQVTGSANSYVQAEIQNLSSGTTASTDLIATANDGTDSTLFVDLGINSSGNTDSSFTIAAAHDSYLYSQGGNLCIGTASAKDLVLFTDGTLAANEMMRVASTGHISFSNGAVLVAPLLYASPTGGDNTTKVASTAFVAPAFNNFGRNKLHNAMFNIQQRGTGAWTASSSYTADRWMMLLNGDSDSVTVATLSDSDRTAIGDEEAIYCLQNAFTGVNSAADYSLIMQKIESVHRLSSKTVSISFWAKANSGTPNVGVSLDQFFGTSGSPSSTVNGTGVSTPISSTWTRYTFANISVPSISGKTLGTDGDDCTYMNIWFSSGSTNATRSGTVGAQSSTISLWGVQLEIGATCTQLEKLSQFADLANCQRFYVTGNAYMAGYGITSTPMSNWISFPVTQRGGAGYTVTSTTSTNCASASATQTAPYGFAWSTTVTSTGNAASGGYWAASADL